MHNEPIRPPLKGRQQADVAILGGGFAGLSTACNLAQRLPGKRTVVLEGARCGYGASGRNGGFADVGLPGLDMILSTEGPEAARAYFGATKLGLDQIQTFVDQHGVDCELELKGVIQLAAEEEDLGWFEEQKELYKEMGIELEVLDQAAARRKVNTERFVGGLRFPYQAILNPAKLARGMMRVIEKMGVEVSEGSRVMSMEPGATVRIVTEFAEVLADIAVVALNGYAPQIGLFQKQILPICNYMVATEPLSESQMKSIAWGTSREGLFDTRAQFMYLRLTADNRIVAGGESTPYFYDSTPSTGNYQPAIDKLCRSLLTTFPQLEGIGFSHAWGGTMAMTRDFMPSVGRMGDHENIFHDVAFNGEGVVMAQLAGQVVAALVAGEESPLTRLAFVNRAMPYVGFEPLRSLGVGIGRRLFGSW